ncbi:MAG: hypothetical protein CM15mP111_0480 [Hyphomicrobiales bacterium]|nr:MAG: hypothetical protein CM15mP111_0480 [Hyphomicrobiales bacterium]
MDATQESNDKVRLSLSSRIDDFIKIQKYLDSIGIARTQIMVRTGLIIFYLKRIWENTLVDMLTKRIIKLYNHHNKDTNTYF